jgi:TrmH family RNA methyltransferase
MKSVTSRDNPFYKDLKALAASSQARRKAGRTLLDGVHLCQSWLDLRGAPAHCVVSEGALQNPEVHDIVARCEGLHAHVTCLPDALFGAVSQVEHGVNLLFLVETPAAVQPQALTVSAVLLDGVQDPGNVGSILRSAARPASPRCSAAPARPSAGRPRCCARRWAPTSCSRSSKTSTWRPWSMLQTSRCWR